MADQVNPLGGLALGMARTLQSLAAAPPSTPTPAKPVESKPKPKAEDQRKEGVSRESLEAAAKSVEDFLRQSPSYLQFGVDQETGTYFFKVVNPETKETIRQVPAEEILVMAKRLRELSDPKDASGVLMDEEG